MRPQNILTYFSRSLFCGLSDQIKIPKTVACGSDVNLNEALEHGALK